MVLEASYDKPCNIKEMFKHVNDDEKREKLRTTLYKIIVSYNKKKPESEVGAMPSFGNLYGMEVFVDESLAEDEDIAFNTGTHIDLIK